MNKRWDFRIQESEFKILEEHCKAVGRTKTDVLRELIRSLKVEEKPATEEGASALRYAPPNFFGKSMDKSFLPLLYPVFPR